MESDFVEDILSQANEKFERKYEVSRLGYDLDRVAARAAEIHGIEAADIYLKGKHQKRVRARSLFCFWAVHELGIILLNWPGILGYVSPELGTRWREEKKSRGMPVLS
jgi:putative transposase